MCVNAYTTALPLVLNPCSFSTPEEYWHPLPTADLEPMLIYNMPLVATQNKYFKYWFIIILQQTVWVCCEDTVTLNVVAASWADVILTAIELS
jgi:hypothetical protein